MRDKSTAGKGVSVKDTDVGLVKSLRSVQFQGTHGDARARESQTQDMIMKIKDVKISCSIV